MKQKLEWAIMGPGDISVAFLNDLRLAGMNLEAVGSRSLDRAESYAKTHSISRAYGSYEDLVADPDIDIVYIATTNNAHFANAKLALSSGKSVLLEKPLLLTLPRQKNWLRSPGAIAFS